MNASGFVSNLIQWTVVVCAAYLLVVYGAYAFMLVVSEVERAIRARGRRADDYELVRASQLTIPASIIAPMYNEAPIAVIAATSFLQADYPEFEVVIVNDGSTDGTLPALRAAFELEPVERFYRRTFATQPVRGIYRSRTHPHLLVIDKENGGKADSLNCGLNFARYRYVCGVDGDTILTRNALLDGMRLVLSDPAEVIGVTGHIAIHGRPESALNAEGAPCRVDSRPLLAFQHLDYLRSFFNNRLGWTRLNMMLCAVGAFQIWRRDVLEEVNGFSTEFTCEDIELTFRIHEKFRRERRRYQILSLAETVGVTEGPDRVSRLIAQRERWQRVIMETVVHYRRMLFNARYGTVGLLGVPFFLLSEVVAPVFELLALLAIIGGFAIGAFPLVASLLMLAAITFANAFFVTAAVLLEDRTSRAYRRRDLLRLILLGPLDLLVYRPLIVFARAKGSWRFLRRDTGWHKFERNARPATTPGA
jgi:cellulose synthase/poly-beta-1,6-N-acetylglucosamine synthase-like glycosyltransferase